MSLINNISLLPTQLEELKSLSKCLNSPAFKTMLEDLEKILKNLRLSARSLNKLLKISRTIADLEESSPITPSHLSEAVLYIREIQIG